MRSSFFLFFKEKKKEEEGGYKNGKEEETEIERGNWKKRGNISIRESLFRLINRARGSVFLVISRECFPRVSMVFIFVLLALVKRQATRYPRFLSREIMQSLLDCFHDDNV